MTGEKIACKSTVLSTELGSPPNQLMAAMWDQASVNSVAMETSLYYLKSSNGCGLFLPHTRPHGRTHEDTCITFFKGQDRIVCSQFKVTASVEDSDRVISSIILHYIVVEQV